MSDDAAISPLHVGEYSIRVPDISAERELPVAGGLAMSPDGTELLVANLENDRRAIWTEIALQALYVCFPQEPEQRLRKWLWCL
jgi:hypothetical protein